MPPMPDDVRADAAVGGHGGWRSANDFFAICNSSWGELMYRLKNYLEGKNPGPRWRD
jgi:hypothetical protein